MEFRTSPAAFTQWEGDTLAVGVLQGDPAGWLPLLSARFSLDLPALLEQRRFKSKPGD